MFTGVFIVNHSMKWRVQPTYLLQQQEKAWQFCWYLSDILYIFISTGELGYDRFLHMTDDMLGPCPMHIEYLSNVYDRFCLWRTNFPGPIESVISKFTCIWKGYFNLNQPTNFLQIFLESLLYFWAVFLDSISQHPYNTFPFVKRANIAELPRKARFGPKNLNNG